MNDPVSRVRRRVLTIGSQCPAVGSDLPFLPRLAVEFDEVMRDRTRGGCAPALPDGRSLLLDPTTDQVDEAFDLAFAGAARESASLFIAYIGHGEASRGDLYLLPADASYPPTMRNAFLLVKRVQELFEHHDGIDGLVLLVDACRSGTGTTSAGRDLVNVVNDVGGRFEILTASDERRAADGCFTQTIIGALRQGHPGLRMRIACADLKKLLLDRCANQTAQHLAYDGRRVSRFGDEGMWLSVNSAHVPSSRPWHRSSTGSRMERLTRWFLPTPNLSILVAATLTDRAILLVGDPGSGKSTLLAALAMPQVAESIVSPDFIHGFLFLSEASTPENLSRVLEEQLRDTVPGFEKAKEHYSSRITDAQRRSLDAWEQRIIGPLKGMPGAPMRLVFDALDQLQPPCRRSVLEFFKRLRNENDLKNVSIIASARTFEDLPAGFLRVPVARSSAEESLWYLTRRGVPGGDHTRWAVDQIGGSWLLAELFADALLAGEETSDASFPSGVQDLYYARMLAAGCLDEDRWLEEFQPVLSALAAAGAGAVLPIDLLTRAAALLGFAGSASDVRSVLVQLGSLVVRADAGTIREHVGLFHPTYSAFLSGSRIFRLIESRYRHRAIAEAIESLLAERPDSELPNIVRYAVAAEANHLWEAGDPDALVASLERRPSPIPAECLRRWQDWRQVLAKLGEDAMPVLRARRNLAWWVAFTGRVGDAVVELTALSRRNEERLGAVHPETVRSTISLAHWTSESGDPEVATEILNDLLSRCHGVLPEDDELILEIRQSRGAWMGNAGHVREALAEFKALLPSLESRFGEDSRAALVARHHIARWTGHTGDAIGALRLYQSLAADERDALEPYDIERLTTEDNLSYWLARSGEVEQALAILRRVLNDFEEYYNLRHQDAMVTRHNLAYFTWQAGDADTALEMYQELLPDQEEILGQYQPSVLRSRHNIAQLMAEIGRPRAALAGVTSLIEDQAHQLGVHHPERFRARHTAANLVGVLGEAERALSLLSEILPGQAMQLGVSHLAVGTTRYNIAWWTAEAGRNDEALALMIRLRDDYLTRLSPSSIDALTVQFGVAHLTALAGQQHAASMALDALLERLKTDIPHSHPLAVRTRVNAGLWRYSFSHDGATVTEFSRLVAMIRRRFGDAHPECLRARYNLGVMLAETGSNDRALDSVDEVLALQRSVLESNHPDIVVSVELRTELVRGFDGSALNGRLRFLRIGAPEHPIPVTRSSSTWLSAPR